MKRGSQIDPGTEAMGYAAPAGSLSHLGGLRTDGQSTAKSDVGLNDMNARVKQALKSPLGNLTFTCRDRHRRQRA